MAVEAERAREAVALQFSKKAQYYDKMKLKDEEFAFKDEEGMPTVCAAPSCHGYCCYRLHGPLQPPHHVGAAISLPAPSMTAAAHTPDICRTCLTR